MKTRLATSMIALSTALAAPAMADVTAADVWSNQQALYKSMGVTLAGDLSGDMLNNPEMNIIFPMGSASIQIKADGVMMMENADGTVTISYPSPLNIAIAGGVPNEGSFTADMTMTHGGYTIIASGERGDITYVVDAQDLRFEVGDISASGSPEGEFNIDGFFEISSSTGTTRVTEGNLIAYSADTEVGETNAEFTFTADGVQSNNTQKSAAIQTTVAATFPVGGSDVMNLSAAMRNGLGFLIESTGGSTESFNETTVGGEVLNSQTTSTGPQTATMGINEDGIVLTADASDFAMTFGDAMLFPGNFSVAMEMVTAVYDIPLNASEDQQDFRVATSLSGLTLGDEIWNLFDPAGQLPRDPAEISFDVTGMGTNGTDLLDIMGLMQMSGTPDVEVDELTIENLRIAAVGAEVTATGAMTFDWTDFQTIPGIARPEGQVTVNVNGANKLMDTLAAMGLFREDDLMMPRMMMGMFATPVGDDMLETVLEVNSEGHVLANGQRLQ